jgi:hypothetical protein
MSGTNPSSGTERHPVELLAEEVMELEPRSWQLAACRAEAEAVLAGPAAELLQDVFAGPATVPVHESR